MITRRRIVSEGQSALLREGAGPQVRRRGFSFIEIIFAVMLLGIGFILFAAMLPTAVIQTQATVDQTLAVQIAKGAGEMLETMADYRTLPVTVTSTTSYYRPMASPLYSFADKYIFDNPDDAQMAWQLVKGKMIYVADRRYAWTALFRRDRVGYGSSTTNLAEVFIWVTRIQVREGYTINDLEGRLPNLRPREVLIDLTEGTVNGKPGPDIVTFHKPFRNTSDYFGIDTPSAVAEGCYVLIADDLQDGDYRSSPTASKPDRKVNGLANGRIYRVGNRRADLGPNKWELMPGYDMPSGIGCNGPGPDRIMGTADDNQNIPWVVQGGKRDYQAIAYVMGRASVDPSDAREFEGPAQDVALFSTFIPVRGN